MKLWHVLVGTALVLSAFAVALFVGATGARDNAAVCRDKTEAVMRQVIDDVRNGTSTVDDKPIPQCLKLPTKERAQIMGETIKKYGPEWTKAIEDSMNTEGTP